MLDKDNLRKYLVDKIHGRERLGPKYEQAALLYARWQGQTEEPSNIREGAKTALDLLIDEMEPEEWDNLSAIVPKLGDKAFRDVLAYAMNRALEQSKDRAKAIAKLKSWPGSEKCRNEREP